MIVLLISVYGCDIRFSVVILVSSRPSVYICMFILYMYVRVDKCMRVYVFILCITIVASLLLSLIFKGRDIFMNGVWMNTSL